MQRVSSQRLIELPVGRDQSSLNDFCEGKVEAIVQTLLRIQCEFVGSRKQSLVGMSLERKMPQLLEDGASLRTSELFSPNLLGDNAAKFHDHESGNMKVFMKASHEECGIRMNFRDEPFNRDTGIDDIAAHRSRSSRIRSALFLNVFPDFLSRTRNLSIRFQAAS